MRTIGFQASVGVHLCTMLFGLSAVLAKGLSLPAVDIVAGRALWASITLSMVLFILRRAQWATLSWRDGLHLICNGMLLAVHWMCFFIGVEQGGVAVGTLGFACFPVFVALFGRVLFGTPVTGRNVIAMLLVALGLAVISPGVLSSPAEGIALAWALAAGLSYAVIVLYNSHVKTAALPLQSSCIQCIACALVILPWGYPALSRAASESFWHVLLIGVLCTGLAYSLLTFALKKVDAGRAAIIISLEPVWAILFAALWFGTLPNIHTLAGGGLIIAAVIISARARR